MRHRHPHRHRGQGPHGGPHDGTHDSLHEGHPGGHRRGGGHRRLFDYGELRLLVLALIAEEPRHGYELIKAIEDRFAGSYSPSPGVIYPTLSWLEDMGYSAITVEAGGRKRHSVTPEGEAFLAASKAQADELMTRARGGMGRGCAPAPVVRAMENLKTALRLRMRGGAIDPETAQKIAAAIDAAALAVEQS
ncbi:PadR family transcriptional regulator [Pannonibacter sp. Pt2]|uniref:PadR family transcriptional regulator n=1 Tax=Pannonibacter anstelovis TaxID=3121537 RepID=A0ABU7ZRV8_9HYPH